MSGGGWVFTIYVSFDRSRPGGVEKQLASRKFGMGGGEKKNRRKIKFSRSSEVHGMAEKEVCISDTCIMVGDRRFEDRRGKKDRSEKHENLVSHSHLSRKFLALNFFTDIAYLYPARCNCL